MVPGTWDRDSAPKGSEGPDDSEQRDS
jgi:hypothetical protein